MSENTYSFRVAANEEIDLARIAMENEGAKLIYVSPHSVEGYGQACLLVNNSWSETLPKDQFKHLADTTYGRYGSGTELFSVGYRGIVIFSPNSLEDEIKRALAYKPILVTVAAHGRPDAKLLISRR